MRRTREEDDHELEPPAKKAKLEHEQDEEKQSETAFEPQQELPSNDSELILELDSVFAAATTTTTITLQPHVAATVQCQSCQQVCKRSSLFTDEPACPMCSTIVHPMAKHCAVNMFQMMATCKQNHTVNQTCLRRNNNANRNCPLASCNAVLRYYCAICGKRSCYQTQTRRNHACFDAFRRK